jgi:hypothetical protein
MPAREKKNDRFSGEAQPSTGHKRRQFGIWDFGFTADAYKCWSSGFSLRRLTVVVVFLPFLHRSATANKNFHGGL